MGVINQYWFGLFGVKITEEINPNNLRNRSPIYY